MHQPVRDWRNTAVVMTQLTRPMTSWSPMTSPSEFSSKLWNDDWCFGVCWNATPDQARRTLRRRTHRRRSPAMTMSFSKTLRNFMSKGKRWRRLFLRPRSFSGRVEMWISRDLDSCWSSRSWRERPSLSAEVYWLPVRRWEHLSAWIWTTSMNAVIPDQVSLLNY